MSEILAETRIRPRNEITVPGIVRDILNLRPGDLIRFERVDGSICVCKAVTRKINCRNEVDGNGSCETSSG